MGRSIRNDAAACVSLSKTNNVKELVRNARTAALEKNPPSDPRSNRPALGARCLKSRKPEVNHLTAENIQR